MSERSCAGALAPFSRTPAFDANTWRGVAAAALVHTSALARAVRSRPRRPRADKAALALAGLNDHTLADIGIHRSQIPAFARRVAERPGADPRGGET
jgi:uncharacterized protein YjiS (DUF1127 family)